MRSRLLSIAAVALLVLACGATGPDTRTGLTPCDQLKECTCDPARTSDVDTCNQTVDGYAALQNGIQLCRALLTGSGCGQLIIVTPPGF